MAYVNVNLPMDAYPMVIDSRMNSLELAIFFDAPYEIIEKLIILGANVNHQRAIHFSKECEGGCNTPFWANPIWTRQYHIEFRTPLLAAWIKQNHEVIQILLNHGANPEKIVFEGTDTFYWNIEASSHVRKGNWLNLNNISN
jgi:hypothetical protein